MNRLIPIVAAGLLAGIAPVTLAERGADVSPDTAASPVRAYDLMVGDTAPKLVVSTWVKGAPVTSFEPGKVYVVEFWATWCGPCIRNIPHLTELQKNYGSKGVTVIGMTSPDRRNTLARVKALVKSKGSQMGYTIAFDDASRTTDRTWMEAAGRNTIPSAFIVNQKGRIAWIGHPVSMDPVLSAVVAGTQDLAAATRAYAQSLQGEAQARQVEQKFSRFASLLLEDRKYDEAYALGRDLVKNDARDNIEALSAIAWIIVDPQRDLERRDVDLAISAAQRAVELGQWSDASVIDTLAWSHFQKGDVNKAIETQARAVKLAQGDMRAFAEQSMATFQAALAEGDSD